MCMGYLALGTWNLSVFCSRDFLGVLPGLEGCRERSIVVAWQRPPSALLTWDRTSQLVFPKQKAAVSNGE